MDPEEQTLITKQIHKIEEIIKKNTHILSENLLNHIVQRIENYGPGYIVFLFYQRYIYKIGSAFQSTHQTLTSAAKQKLTQLFNYLLKVSDSFFIQSTNLKIQSAKQFIENNSIDETNNATQNGEERAAMRWIQTFWQKKGHFTRKEVHDYVVKIEEELRNNEFGEDSIYAEIILNWLRVQLEKQKRRIDKQGKNNKLCCKLDWSFTEEMITIEEMHLQFKKFTYPFQKNLQYTLKKLMIAFLNTNGGIAFIGIDKKQVNKQSDQGTKKLILIGMALTYNMFPDVYTTFTNLVDDICPKHEGFPSKKAKKMKQFLIRDRLRMPINDYISIEFSPIINLQTLQNQRKKQKVMYILKLYVKKGHPRHLYHLLNKEKSLQFFIRNQSQDGKMLTVNKIKVPEGLNMVSERAKQSKKSNGKEQRKDFHENCCFSMQIEKIEKIQDEGFEDFDSDDDFY